MTSISKRDRIGKHTYHDQIEGAGVMKGSSKAGQKTITSVEFEDLVLQNGTFLYTWCVFGNDLDCIETARSSWVGQEDGTLTALTQFLQKGEGGEVQRRCLNRSYRLRSWPDKLRRSGAGGFLVLVAGRLAD